MLCYFKALMSGPAVTSENGKGELHIAVEVNIAICLDALYKTH